MSVKGTLDWTEAGNGLRRRPAQEGSHRKREEKRDVSEVKVMGTR